MRKKIVVLTLIGFVVFVYFTMGLFVMSPTAATDNKGGTVLYWRCGIDLPFIFSSKFVTDPILAPGKVIALSTFAELLKEISKERKIITLPYSKTLYSISTKVFIYIPKLF